jgi:ubiquinone/menaquinone biosynthesis C-methylase UbiE
MSQDTDLLRTFLERNLPDMATTFDEGLGIASERYSVNKALLRFAREHMNGHRVERVLEAPVDGLMGIPGMNSVVLARDLGAEVVVGSPSQGLLDHASRFWSELDLRDKVQFEVMGESFPYPDNTFDWVWNYCTFEHYDDARSLLLEMKRVSRRYVCIVTQNAYNYGYPIHRLYHALHRQPWDHGSSHWMKLGNLVRLFHECGLNVVARGCVDVPPWFDTFDMHTRGKIKQYMSNDGAQAWFWSSLQPGDMDRLAQNRLIKWLERFESSLFFPINYLFAHHFYVIGEIQAEREVQPQARSVGVDAPESEKVQLYDFAEGFGSVYGRYVRKRLSQRLIRKYNIRTVLEAPCNAEAYFASPGTQSVVFAQEGCQVTLLHPDEDIVDRTRAFWKRLDLGETEVLHHTDLYHLPFGENQFDLVWNFDYIPLLADPSRFIAEMARVSRDKVMIIVPNFLNIGYPLHALLNVAQRRPSPWGARRWMATAPVTRALRSAGLEVIATGIVDAPPWPGFDAMNIVGRFVRRHTVEGSKEQRTDAETEHMLSRLTFIEYAPLPTLAKLPFAHQLYVLAQKRKA